MPSEPEETSPSLLSRMQTGDPAAWRSFVAIYGPLIYDWARLKKVGAVDAEDIVQEVLTAVSTHLAEFRPDGTRGCFRNWLWGICGYKIHDHFREAADRKSVEGVFLSELSQYQVPNRPPALDSEEGGSELVQLRHRAVLALRDRFEPQVWTAFWQVVVEGKSPARVARSLKVSVWAVYKARTRVLRRLREELDGLIDP